jgi:hypothetical protein
LDRFERETPLALAKIEMFLRQLLVEKLHSGPEQFFKVVPLLLELLPLLLLGRVQRRPGDAGTLGEEMERFNECRAPRAHHPCEDITALSAVETVPQPFGNVDFEAESAAATMGRVPAFELIAGPSERGVSCGEQIVIDDLF